MVVLPLKQKMLAELLVGAFGTIKLITMNKTAHEGHVS